MIMQWLLTLSPFCPCGPVLPDKPGGPRGPGNPGVPAGPCSPRAPLSPGIPSPPEGPYNVKYQLWHNLKQKRQFLWLQNTLWGCWTLAMILTWYYVNFVDWSLEFLRLIYLQNTILSTYWLTYKSSIWKMVLYETLIQLILCTCLPSWPAGPGCPGSPRAPCIPWLPLWPWDPLSPYIIIWQ